MKLIYQACDGSLWPTADDCRVHDEATPEHVLANRTAAEILAGIERRDPEIAGTLERLGTKIARDRRADGEFLRERAKKAEAPILAIEAPRAETPPTVEDMRDSGLVQSLIRTREFEDEDMRA